MTLLHTITDQQEASKLGVTRQKAKEEKREEEAAASF